MFIEGPKYRKLVEAMNNGDERAKAILIAQYHGDDGIDSLMEDYFKPAEPEKEIVEEEPKPETHEDKMKKFLNDNGINEGDPEYEEAVNEFNKENENDNKEECGCDIVQGVEDLIADEIEAVQGYQSQILVITNSDLPDTVKTGILAKYNEIINEELHHIEELKDIKANIEKKSESHIEKEAEKI